MHKQWEDLIPFYIAHTLPRHEAAALEQHLASCESCTRALEEWRTIAAAVRTQAASQLRDLPPLSPAVFARRQPVKSTRRDPLRWLTPAALAAAGLAIVVGIGLILLIVSRSLRPIEDTMQMSIASLLTVTAVDAVAAGSAQQTPTGMSTEPPTPTPTESPMPPPSFRPTQRPPVQPLVRPSQLPPTQPDAFGGASGARLPFAAQTTVVPEVLPEFPATATPFSLPTLTPTPESQILVVPDAPNDGACGLYAAVSQVSLYTGPGFAYAPLITLSVNDSMTPLARGDNGWYRIEANIRGGLWLGWVQPEIVTVMGDCSALPTLRTQNYAPESGVPTSAAPMDVDPSSTALVPSLTMPPLTVTHAPMATSEFE